MIILIKLSMEATCTLFINYEYLTRSFCTVVVYMAYISVLHRGNG